MVTKKMAKVVAEKYKQISSKEVQRELLDILGMLDKSASLSELQENKVKAFESTYKFISMVEDKDQRALDMATVANIIICSSMDKQGELTLKEAADVEVGRMLKRGAERAHSKDVIKDKRNKGLKT